MMLAWCMLFAQHVLNGSSTVLGNASAACVVSVLACAIWAGARFAVKRMPIGCGVKRAGGLGCGVAAAAAGIALAFSPGGALSFALLAACVLPASEAAYRELQLVVQMGDRDILAAAGGAMALSGIVHAVARMLAGSLGSPGNVGTLAQASLVVVALLPAASSAAVFARQRAREGGHGEAAAARQPASAASSRGLRARRRIVFAMLPPSHGVPARAVLVCLVAVSAAIATLFCGVVTSPYQVDMLLCGDSTAAASAVLGAAVLAVSRIPGVRVPEATGIASAAALAAMIAGMLAFAFSDAPIATPPLIVVSASCNLLVAMAATGCALGRPQPGGGLECAVMLLTACMALRFAGMALKQVLGLDMHTLTAFVLAVMVTLVCVLALAVLYVTLSTGKAIRHVQREGAIAAERAAEEAARTAAEQAVDAIRHDPVFAFDAMRTLYREFLMQYKLTKREEEVAVLQLEGNTIESIAAATGISVNTVRFHLRHIYQKVGATGKLELRDKASEALAEVASRAHGSEDGRSAAGTMSEALSKKSS